MTTGTPLFLDTSIQISRRGSLDDVTKIDEILKEYTFLSTSSFVRFEFRQSIIQHLVYIHRILAEEKSFSKAIERVSKLGPFWQRKSNTILAQLVPFFAEFNASGEVNDKVFAEKAVYYFENLIDELWEWFDESVDYVSDEIKCINARKAPEKKKTFYDLKLRKQGKTHCELHNFLTIRKDDFLKILQKIDSLDPNTPNVKFDELRKNKKAIEEGLANPDAFCDGSLCRSLGDALVAVEALHYQELFTKDSDQASIICEAIGLKARLLTV